MNQQTKSDSSDFKNLLTDLAYFKIPQVGEVVKGKILSATKREIRIDVQGLTTGVIRGRELYGESKEYANLEKGDEVEATVMELENENGEMELSFRYAGHKRAWDDLVKLKKEKEIVQAEVIDANKGGLMIKLNHITGFLPVSQLIPEHYPRVSGGDKIKILEKLKKLVGQSLEVKVLDAVEGENKLIVSEKAAWEEKQKDVISSYKIGDIVEGIITAVTDFGAFIKFDSLEGLIHISELAWQRIDNPHDFVKVGEKIKAEIISIERSKIFLSIKKMTEDPWKDIDKKYQLGQKVKGKVLKTNPFGLFVELDPDIHGLAHISELSQNPEENISQIAKPGDILEFFIVSIEPKHHRLGLSLKEEKAKEQKKKKKEEKV